MINLKNSLKNSKTHKNMKGGMHFLRRRHRTVKENKDILKNNRKEISKKMDEIMDEIALQKAILNNLNKSVNSVHYDIVDFIENVKIHYSDVNHIMEEMKNINPDEENEDQENVENVTTVTVGGGLNTIPEESSVILSEIEKLKNIEIDLYDFFDNEPFNYDIMSIKEKIDNYYDTVLVIIRKINTFITNKDFKMHLLNYEDNVESLKENIHLIIPKEGEKDKKIEDLAKKSGEFLRKIKNYKNQLEILHNGINPDTPSRLHRLRKGFGNIVNSTTRRLSNARNHAKSLGRAARSGMGQMSNRVRSFGSSAKNRMSRFGKNISNRLRRFRGKSNRVSHPKKFQFISDLEDGNILDRGIPKFGENDTKVEFMGNQNRRPFGPEVEV